MTLFLLRGDARFVGDDDGVGSIDVSCSNVCDGSMFSSLAVVLLRRPFALGVC